MLTHLVVVLPPRHSNIPKRNHLRRLSGPRASIHLPEMEMQCFPRGFTGFTNEQQIEFRSCLNDHMLLIVSINGVPLEEDFPLLWVPILRENQIVEGYNPATDRVFLLSRHPPVQWRPIQVALSQRWAQQYQLQQQISVAQNQALTHGSNVAVDQPQMSGLNHPQQIQMNEYDMEVGQPQVPEACANPQHNAMNLQSNRGPYSSVVDPSLSVVDPSLGFAPQQEVSPGQHEQTTGWSQTLGLPYDQQQDVTAAATQGAADQGPYMSSSGDVFNADQTATESGELYTYSAADDLFEEDMWTA